MVRIADSVTEFSGTQGQNNWYYGYYDGPFTSSDFQRMREYKPDGGTFGRPAWYVQDFTYWTVLWASGGHPNGRTGGGRTPGEQWAVRRYISEVDGEITITGNLADDNPDPIALNGIIGRIFVDGQQVWSYDIANGDTTGINYIVTANVRRGSVIDFAIDPKDSNEDSDSTTFTAEIAAALELSINNSSIDEGNSGQRLARFTVTLSNPFTDTVTVDYTTANGTGATGARAGSDFNPLSGTLIFNPGQTTNTISVPIIGDATSELDETFSVNLSNANGADIFNSQGVATIINDDSQLAEVSISDVSVTEGNRGTAKQANFRVTLSDATNEPVTVNYTTANGRGATGATVRDFNAVNGSLTFTQGQTTKTISVPIKGDTQVELDETFSVKLSQPSSNAVIIDGKAIGTILNDDLPTISIEDIRVREGNRGRKNAEFDLTLSDPISERVTVRYTTANGTAKARQDYIAKTGTVTFQPRDTTQTITIPITGDTLFERNETFFVNLSNARNATIDDTRAMGTITNDDRRNSRNINDLLFPQTLTEVGQKNEFTSLILAPSKLSQFFNTNESLGLDVSNLAGFSEV